MPAFRIVAWGEAPRLVEVPVPEPGPGQVVVAVAGCGLCHSDEAIAQMPAALGAAIGWTVPFTLGHETAGWVHAVGAGVAGLVEGDAVALASPTSCGACRWCLREMEAACPHGSVGRGYGRDGGLAPYVLVDDPVRASVRLPAVVDPATAGPLTDAAATSHHAVARVRRRLPADATVVVIGAGGLGTFAVQLLRALTDARVVAIDPDPARRRIALDVGAHEVVDGVDDATPAALGELLAGEPLDAVIDVVGTDATIALAASTVAPGGSIVVVGAAGGTLRRPWYGGLPRDAEIVTFQGSDLADLHAVIDLAAAGAITVATDRYPLAEVDHAYADLAAARLQGRAVIDPRQP